MDIIVSATKMDIVVGRNDERQSILIKLGSSGEEQQTKFSGCSKHYYFLRDGKPIRYS
jgi:hypothetical protein